ncbi:MAG: peptidoglycan DD-metalloendopeptidase family protein [Oscillospiraceae bacterium]
MKSRNGENGKQNNCVDFVPPVSISESSSKKSKLEGAVVNMGALIAYTFSYGASRTANYIAYIAGCVKNAIGPAHHKAANAVKSAIGKITTTFADAAAKVREGSRAFAENVRTNGFGFAVRTMLSNAVEAAKREKNLFKKILNYAFPAASVVFLFTVVYGTASTSYGIAVECNGTELGVVSAESVITDAQQSISDKNVYYSTDDTALVSTNLSIKPINSMDEIIDEVELIEKMQEQIDITLPEEDQQPAPDSLEEEAEEAADALTSDELDGKVRAYTVMINGSYYAAVESTDQIEEYIEELKEPYMEDPDVVSVGFDKSVEYTYEQFVYPTEIVSQQDIIDKLGSIAAEPVYYEVQSGDNPWNIASHNDISLDELLACPAVFEGDPIQDITLFCPVGAVIELSAEVPYLQTLVTKTETYNVPIDYEIVKTEDDDLYKGETKVDVAGVEGEAEVTALVTYKNGVAISRNEQSRIVLSEPVTKQVRVGTRPTSTAVSTGSGGSGEYFWPVDGGYISAYKGDGRGHKGIDIAAPYGTPIYAAAAGTVTRAANKYDGYGNSVIIANDDGNVTMYAHMSSIAISYGEYVVKGQLIGYVGSTGYSTGNHLHFEIRSNGYYLDPTDYVSQY